MATKQITIITHEEVKLALPGFSVTNMVWDELDGSENLRESDGIILDVTGLRPSELDEDVWGKVMNMDVASDVLRASGGFIVVIGDHSLKSYSSGDDGWRIQRDFLDWAGYNVPVSVGKGRVVSITDQGKVSPIANYLAKVDSYDFWYENPSFTQQGLRHYTQAASGTAHRPQGHVVNLLSNKPGRPLALRLDVSIGNYFAFPGEIYLLPSLSGTPADRIELALKEISKPVQKSEPEWVQDLVAPGQADIDKAVDDDKAIIRDAEERIAQNSLKRDQVRSVLKPLFEEGHPLEHAVAELLERMGANVVEPVETNRMEFTFHTPADFVAEVKGTTKPSVGQEGLRQLIDWGNDAYDQTHRVHKAVLFVSHQLNKPVADRAEPMEFAQNLVEYAEHHDIVVITVIELYMAWRLTETGELDPKAFWGALATQHGRLNLPGHDLSWNPAI